MASQPKIYLFQFSTGTQVNLLPLAAGQLLSRLRIDRHLLDRFDVGGVVFRRENSADIAKKLGDVVIAGFSCFLWNMNVSLQTATEIRRYNPQSRIILGGPAVPKKRKEVREFLLKNQDVDLICTGEGEEVFTSICKAVHDGASLEGIPGIIYRDRKNNDIIETMPVVLPNLDTLPSPFLDGVFDEIYTRNAGEFSGICWETNRGCPYECTYCTWGNMPSHQMRMKPMTQVVDEIEWMGRNQVKYVASADSNFGVMPRDVEIAKLLAACKKKYGYPVFISVSWAKHAPKRVLEIGKILKEAEIGFRVTLSLQSLNQDVIKAIKRSNYTSQEFNAIKKSYHQNHLYSYTELILGLPLETYISFLNGVEKSLSDSVYEQVYVYPLFLFPNTSIGSDESRTLYGLQSKIIPNRYTKSKENANVEEFVEIVVGTSTMGSEEWIDSFVEGYYMLALHDCRLAFFILRYLKKEFSITLTELVTFTRRFAFQKNLQTIKRSFDILEGAARRVQEGRGSHLIEPSIFSGIPYDPSDAVFLELLPEKDNFYIEFQHVVMTYLESSGVPYDKAVLDDLLKFQSGVIAHPNTAEQLLLNLSYDWISYFGFVFGLPDVELSPSVMRLQIKDPHPSDGDPIAFLKNHFDVRGVPPFNLLLDERGITVFPTSIS